jgi:LPS export ABC transporter protein LptC
MLSSVYIRPLLALVVTAAVISIAAVIYRNGSHGPSPEKSAIQQLPHNIDIALQQARFSEIKGGLVVWELAAMRVEYDKSGGVAHLSGGIRIDFSRSDTRGAVVATADRGDYFSNSNTILLRGKVHIQTGDGATFDSDSLDYTSADSRFTTDGPVTFVQERLTLKATGMVFGVKEQHARFFSMIEATVDGITAIMNTTHSRTKKI